MPERPVDKEPTAGRGYNSEKLEWQQDQWEGDNSDDDLMRNFYRELHKSLRESIPLTITPQSVRRQIAIIEKAKEIGGFA
jgi:hypothetical protein